MDQYPDRQVHLAHLSPAQNSSVKAGMHAIQDRDRLDCQGGEDQTEQPAGDMGAGPPINCRMREAYSSEGEVRPDTINNTIRVVIKEETLLTTEDIGNTASQGARTCDQGKSQWKDRDIVFAVSLALLAHGGGAQTRLARKHHIDGPKKQHRSPGDTEGGQADAQCGPLPVPGELEYQ